jgi:hypothetical protein
MPTKANVFLLQTVGPLGPEDRLTAFWHYVLTVVPGVGQAFIDHVCDRAGLEQTKFLGAIDHPTGDRANHPDLLIRCRDWDLLFEHKLDSPLGSMQLRRYVTLSKKKRWKVALLAANCHAVDPEIAEAACFVKPLAVDPPHFFWQDVHEVLRDVDHHIAQEFREYLEAVGVGKFEWAGLGNPFIDDAAAAALRSLYDELTPLFKRPGTSCRTRERSTVYEVRRPFEPVHLINVSPVPTVADWDRRLWGPVMALTVFVRRGPDDSRVLSAGKGYVRGSNPRIFINDTVPIAPPKYDPQLQVEREYYVPLSEVLQQSKEVSARRLREFVEATVAHLLGRRLAQRAGRVITTPELVR